MNYEWALFEEGTWTIMNDIRDGPYVLHRDCPKGYPVRSQASATFLRDRTSCYFCKEDFPDFISKMWTFVGWCEKG